MSADGTSLVSFQDFVLATKAHKITPTTEILNEAVKRTYLLRLMLKGRGNDEVVQSGSKIIDQIQLKKMSNAGFYKPNQTLNPKGVDVLSQIECPWRFHQGNYAWTNEQVELNVSNGGGSLADIYTRLKTLWEQACDVDIFDSLEDALWATPDNAEMESSTGKQPYSIPTFLTDDGLAPSGFTTVMTINPSDFTRWRNQSETFDWSTATGGSDTGDLLYVAFDKMSRKLRWRRQRGITDKAGNRPTEGDKLIICTNGQGQDGYTALNRQANDRLRSNARNRNDAGFGNTPTFNDIPVEYIEQLDTTLTADVPKYFWLNLEYLFPVFHANKYMTQEGPIRGSTGQPFSYAVYKNTYLNLFCRSRQRQGVVYTT